MKAKMIFLFCLLTNCWVSVALAKGPKYIPPIIIDNETREAPCSEKSKEPRCRPPKYADGDTSAKPIIIIYGPDQQQTYFNSYTSPNIRQPETMIQTSEPPTPKKRVLNQPKAAETNYQLIWLAGGLAVLVLILVVLRRKGAK
jgi:hypothetical protein